MAVPSASASESDSSSEEDVQKLREAAWSFDTKETQKQTQAGENTKGVRNGFASARPSRRPRVDEHEHDANELQTTPEFRAHVAKKLSAMLDGSITVTEEAASPPAGPGSDNDGFRLFSTSVPGGTAEPDPPPAARRRPPPSSSDSDSEMEERLREAAVSGTDILKHSAIPSQQNQGVQEEGRKGVREEGGSCSEQSATPLVPKKKKKKKKLKESRLEEEGNCTPETGRKIKAKRDT
ncbi:protein CUSTOS-like [Polyodon spathula]|uniref:protein CUSTOS-like n=1 Tax=Polyodon spathula TaxID=7913 RepID=UPI001B7DC063|nr:protein CUSTOS-like [Polyodon spathula]